MTDTGSKLSLLIPLRLELVLAFPHLTSTYLSGSSADLVSSGPPHNKEPTASFPNLSYAKSNLYNPYPLSLNDSASLIKP